MRAQDIKDTIVLSIGHVIIKLSFSISKKMTEPDIRDIVRREYGSFITAENASPDVELIFNSRLGITILEAKNNTYAFIYKTQNRKNKIYTYCDISAQQLSMIIHKQIIRCLKNKGFFFHASSILVNNSIYLFLGLSGAGKSTISRLLQESIGTLFSDDYLIVKKQESSYYAYQLPGYENCIIEKSSVGFPISKIFFLKKSKICAIRNNLDKTIIMEGLVQQLKTERNSITQNIRLIVNMIALLEVCELHFSLDKKKLIRLFKTII